MIKILTLGDVVGTSAVEYLKNNLWSFRSSVGADFVVANGENAADIHGISAVNAQDLFDSGVDLITLGNHTYGRRDICTLLSDSQNIIRPANYPPLAPGSGYTILNICGWRILGINILGTALMDSMACPFATVDRILERERGSYDIALLDIHAEATSEKNALGRYFDGRIHVIFGTHTHVPTADEQILPKGSGYITDIGMTGPVNSVIGTDIDAVIEKMRTKMPVRFTVAGGDVRAQGALFTLDTDSMKVIHVERVTF
ncbi:MAG: TIGR00282 family metallophosphoesterase [Ruminococcaceae bacterium]|nr:TIGR00282 family metallophosphoesterase [Oscillospiraceae bacterium]